MISDLSRLILLRHWIRRYGIASAALLVAAGSGFRLSGQSPAGGPADTVSLSLYFENGAMKPLTFYGNPPRYLNEIDIVSSAPPKTADDGIDSLIKSSPVFEAGLARRQNGGRGLACIRRRHVSAAALL